MAQIEIHKVEQGGHNIFITLKNDKAAVWFLPGNPTLEVFTNLLTKIVNEMESLYETNTPKS